MAVAEKKTQVRMHIDPELWARAKSEAALARVTLVEYIEALLVKELDGKTRK